MGVNGAFVGNDEGFDDDEAVGLSVCIEVGCLVGFAVGDAVVGKAGSGASVIGLLVGAI